jgi:hypothetical protein
LKAFHGPIFLHLQSLSTDFCSYSCGLGQGQIRTFKWDVQLAGGSTVCIESFTY